MPGNKCSTEVSCYLPIEKMGEHSKPLPKVRRAEPHPGGALLNRLGVLLGEGRTPDHPPSCLCPVAAHPSFTPWLPGLQSESQAPRGYVASQVIPQGRRMPSPALLSASSSSSPPHPPPCLAVEGQPPEEPAQKRRKVKCRLIPPAGPLIAIPDTNCN